MNDAGSNPAESTKYARGVIVALLSPKQSGAGANPAVHAISKISCLISGTIVCLNLLNED